MAPCISDGAAIERTKSHALMALRHVQPPLFGSPPAGMIIASISGISSSVLRHTTTLHFLRCSSWQFAYASFLNIIRMLIHFPLPLRPEFTQLKFDSLKWKRKIEKLYRNHGMHSSAHYIIVFIATPLFAHSDKMPNASVQLAPRLCIYRRCRNYKQKQ